MARLIVNVKVSVGKTAKIRICRGDDPLALAHRFGLIYSLDNAAVQVLHSVLVQAMQQNALLPTEEEERRRKESENESEKLLERERERDSGTPRSRMSNESGSRSGRRRSPSQSSTSRPVRRSFMESSFATPFLSAEDNDMMGDIEKLLEGGGDDEYYDFLQGGHGEGRQEQDDKGDEDDEDDEEYEDEEEEEEEEGEFHDENEDEYIDSEGEGNDHVDGEDDLSSFRSGHSNLEDADPTEFMQQEEGEQEGIPQSSRSVQSYSIYGDRGPREGKKKSSILADLL